MRVGPLLEHKIGPPAEAIVDAQQSKQREPSFYIYHFTFTELIRESLPTCGKVDQIRVSCECDERHARESTFFSKDFFVSST